MPLHVAARTTWVQVRGVHHGTVVEVRRATPNAVYFRITKEGASMGPKPRKGGRPLRLDHAAFLNNYRPYTRRDWVLASAPAPAGTPTTELDETMTDVPAAPHTNGLLHPQELAIAEAIRSGAKYHDVQRDYHVQGLVLHNIIEKHGVPYQTVRQRDEAKPKRVKAAEPREPMPVVTAVQAAQATELLHPLEEEMAEMLRTRAGSFQDVLRMYHVSPKLLVAIRNKHGIPAQTDEERKAYSRAHYQATKDRKVREALAAGLQAANAPPATPPAVPTPAPTPPPPTPPTEELWVQPQTPQPASPQRTWQVTLRTTITVAYPAATYLAAAQAAQAQHPDGEIIAIVQKEGGA